VNITADHPVLTERGWVCAGDLTTDDMIVTLGGPCRTCGVWCRGSYCSTKCTGEAIKKRRMCRSCGQAIPQKGKKKSKLYCSQACVGAAMRVHSDRRCAHCGTEMIGRWKKPLSKERRFCSRSCYRAFKGETSIEKAVREHLETLPFKFEQEQQFGEYIVDFHLPERSLAIEVDGEYWHGIGGKPADRVQRRADYLAGLGLTVLHIPESAVISGRFTSWIERALDV
jgi:very-short-patch-repair endonuclease